MCVVNRGGRLCQRIFGIRSRHPLVFRLSEKFLSFLLKEFYTLLNPVEFFIALWVDFAEAFQFGVNFLQT